MTAGKTRASTSRANLAIRVRLLLDALMMAVWRRKPDSKVFVHSDQGSEYGSDDWQRFCRANNLSPSMSRRDNC